ncbi:Cysteine-rich secretory protein family [[Clostridium] ultunense Esp]|uniref:CAP-associated domain-containing protein n=1 Tax=Thermicanus aegyptius TaxID=94009 RepID=UPI0002B6FD52|nr:CAP-associated domain-containing protein [Thermicanus aegyptius]CCQ97650.1 Cysteine-rich secretory protein family [[Clostridium] ultunense Esp]
MKKKILIVLVLFLLFSSTSIADGLMKQIRVALPRVTFFFDEMKDLEHLSGTFFNGKTEVPLAFNYEGTTYVPLRYIGEKLGKEVGYDPNTQSIWVGKRPAELSTPSKNIPAQKEGVYGIHIGQSAQEVTAILGNPNRKEFSRLKYEWWIYNRDLERYVQVGVMNGKVVDLYSNAPTWEYQGVKVGSEKSVVEGLQPQNTVTFPYDGATFTIENNSNERRLLVQNGVATILYLDLHNRNRVTAIRQLSLETLVRSQLFTMKYSYYTKAPEISPPTLSAQEQEAVDRGNERIIFDLVNVVRARFGLSTLSWNEKAAEVARGHSVDMWQHHFFAHVSATTGLSPADRIEQAAISYRMTGENIAKGYHDAVEAHEGWMNSEGHRRNILEKEFTTLGVGVKEDLYTQEFVTPR